jgi:hypothetical protein
MGFFDVLLRILALFGAVAGCVVIIAVAAVFVSLVRGVIRDIDRGCM